MNTIEQFETNVINSFRMAKTDIIKVQNVVSELNKRQKNILEQLASLKKENVVLKGKVKKNTSKIVKPKKSARAPAKKIIIKRIVKRAAKGKYVASVEGDAYHEPKNVWAKQIKTSNKVWFSSRKQAEKAGYKPAPELR